MLDICPVSNVRVGVVPSMEAPPLPAREAGVLSLSTDDRRCSTPTSRRSTKRRARSGSSRRSFYAAGVAGALCDEQTKARLAAIGDAYDWSALDARQAALG